MAKTQLVPITTLLSQSEITGRFNELLGKKAQGFISTLIQVVNTNHLLKEADRTTILNAAAMAASMDLSINPNLGFAYLIPYKNNRRQIVECQFQIGSKGLVQLGHRTKLYTGMNSIEIHESNFVSWNPFTEELELNFRVPKEGDIVGFASWFQLTNGFVKRLYWTKEEVTKHAKRYSKSWGQASSSWTKNFDSMGRKTLLKTIIRGYGPMSVDLENAILADQSVIKEGKFDYVDAPKGLEIDALNQESERKSCMDYMVKCKTLEDLQKCESSVDALGLREDYDMLADNFKKG